MVDVIQTIAGVIVQLLHVEEFETTNFGVEHFTNVLCQLGRAVASGFVAQVLLQSIAREAVGGDSLHKVAGRQVGKGIKFDAFPAIIKHIALLGVNQSND